MCIRDRRCEVCYRACPLIDEAIRIDYRPREGDAIHAVFAPQVIDELSLIHICRRTRAGRTAAP